MALLASAPARRNEQQQIVDAELVFDNSIRPSDESSYKFNSREDVLPVQNVVEPKIEKNVKRNDHQDPRTMLTPDVESKVVPKAIFTSKRSKIWINFHCCNCSEFSDFLLTTGMASHWISKILSQKPRMSLGSPTSSLYLLISPKIEKSACSSITGINMTQRRSARQQSSVPLRLQKARNYCHRGTPTACFPRTMSRKPISLAYPGTFMTILKRASNALRWLNKTRIACTTDTARKEALLQYTSSPFLSKTRQTASEYFLASLAKPSLMLMLSATPSTTSSVKAD